MNAVVLIRTTPSSPTARISSVALRTMLFAYPSTAACVALTISARPVRLLSTSSRHWLSAWFCSSCALKPRKSFATRVIPLEAEKYEETPVSSRVARMRGTTMRTIFQRMLMRRISPSVSAIWPSMNRPLPRRRRCPGGSLALSARDTVEGRRGVPMQRTALGLVLCVFLVAAVPRAAYAVERITPEKPLVSSDQAELAGVITDLLDQASAVIARLYPRSLVIAPQGSSGATDYTLATVASREKDVLSLVVSLTRTSDGSKTPTLVWSAPLTPDMPLWLARAVFLLWGSFHGYLADQAAEPPVFVDDLPGSVLNPLMPPMGVAVTSRGTLAVALIMSCLELDHTYRQVGEPAKSLGDKGVQLYAGSVAATPAGSLLLKPTMGRDLYRVQPNGLEAQRIPTGLELSLVYYWTALPDGSALLVDATNRKAYKAAPGKRRQELPLFPNPSSWPTAYAAGPDGSIWVYDPQLRGVRIFTAEGTPLDIVLPLTDPATVLSPAAMAVGPDGGFVLLSNSALYRFRPDGRLAWTMTALAGSEQGALPASASIAVDWSRGLIYLCDLASRRITKILDRAWCRENSIRNDFEERVIALRAGKPGDEAGTLARTAKLYESVGSTMMAKAYWQKVEDADPGNPDADARLQAIEVEELRAAARELDDKARTTRAAIGIETARPWSVQAIQKYELLLSKAPDDEKSRAAMEDLRKLFSQAAPEPERKKPLSITEFHLVNLFPSLMHWYALHPPGTVTVTNSLPEAARKVRASLFIPGYMELPYETTSPVDLAPGKSATFSLAPVFKQDVLANNQEDMTVQAQVTVTWTVGAEEQTTSRVGSATIYRNTALTWDDTRKISSYITPNEATVSGFAARVLSGGVPPDGRSASLPEPAAGHQDLRCRWRLRHHLRAEPRRAVLQGAGKSGDHRRGALPADHPAEPHGGLQRHDGAPLFSPGVGRHPYRRRHDARPHLRGVRHR